eukprot:g25155.t1
MKEVARGNFWSTVQFWSPHYRKDTTKLERAQKNFTRMLPGMEGLSYKERLDGLVPFSLEHRRMMGDFIEVYKIMRSMDKVNSKGLFPQTEEFKTTGHIFQ